MEWVGHTFCIHGTYNIINYLCCFFTNSLIKRICEKLGISVDSVVLPEFKVSPGRTHYRTYYNEVSKEIITKLFTRELNLFNYEF